jgi:3-oxoacyl-[acyl-carrier protein] reductase
MPSAIVTGAGSGIGRATADALAARGLDVVLLGRTEATLRETARALARHGGRVLALRADVSRGPELEAAATRAIAELGAPAVVVCNAGTAGRLAPVEELAEAEWADVIATNLTGVFLTTRAFLPAMRAAKRGRVVHVASISSTLGTPRMSAYCASKWGVVGFMKSLAEELRGSGLQTMAVLPGSVETPMLRTSGFAPKMTPEDVARTIAYLALDAVDAMNGSAVEVFGA